MDFSNPATLAWFALRYLLLWSFFLVWQCCICVLLSSPADGSDSPESDGLSDDPVEGFPHDTSDPWPDTWPDDTPRRWVIREKMRLLFPPRFSETRRVFKACQYLPSYVSPACGPAWRHPGPGPRDFKFPQLRFSRTGTVPPSNTTLSRNITKVFERAPGLWPP